MARWARSMVVLGALLASPALARAQSATVQMTADRTHVGVGETLQVQVRADAQGGEMESFEVPDFAGFQIVSRRVARPMQFSFGFGTQQRVVQSSTVYDFTLRALSEGTFPIEPARAKVGGRSYESDPLTLVVGSGVGTPPVPGAPGGSAPPGGSLDGATYDDAAFIRTVVDRDSAYVGEQVTATVYLYSRSGIRSSPTVHQEPITDGYWVHDLLPPNRMLEPHRQVVRGVPFNVYVLRRFAAFPLEPGEHPLGGMQVTLQAGAIFDLFNPQVTEIRRSGAPLKIRAKPLPSRGQPAGTVVVGALTLESELDRSQVATGDAVTLRAVARGTGNLRDVRLSLPQIPGLRILQPQVRDDIRAPGDLVGGARTYEWLVVPEQPGTHRIPPLELHAFDPTTSRYETLRTDAHALVAAGNAVTGAGEPVPVGPEVGGEAPEGVAEAFGPIRTRSELGRRREPIATSGWLVGAAAIPPVAWLLVVLTGLARRRAAARDALTAPRRAVKKARRRLAQAEAHAVEGQPRAFYGEVFQVLKNVLEARLGEPVGGFTHDELRRHLAVRGMADDLALRVVDELEGLEFARFSASGIEHEEMEVCMRRVGALLERLDRFTPTEEER